MANARVAVSSRGGKELAQAATNAQGIANFTGLSPEPPQCADGNDGSGGNAYFVSARAADDLAFNWSDWHKGIEPWRFNRPVSREARPDERAHTIFDRTLLRAGETVSMKHILRLETGQGFALPTGEKALPATLVVTHTGSGQQYIQSVAWRKTASGGLSAESTFAVPPAAKLGVYTVQLKAAPDKSGEREIDTGQFHVEEFRLPVLEGRVTPSDKRDLVNARSVPADVQINYVAGGGAANLPVRVSALVRGKTLSFADYEEFSFSPPKPAREGKQSEGEEEAAASQDQRVIADKLPLTLDKNGAGKIAIADVPAARQAQELLLEATYADPSGASSPTSGAPAKISTCASWPRWKPCRVTARRAAACSAASRSRRTSGRRMR